MSICDRLIESALLALESARASLEADPGALRRVCILLDLANGGVPVKATVRTERAARIAPSREDQ